MNNDYKTLEAPPNNIRVRVHLNGSQMTTFVDGKVYDAVRSNGVVFSVIDELGHLRKIIPNEPSPHLPEFFSWSNGRHDQKSVGVFEVVL